jgi:hypothetical protein
MSKIRWGWNMAISGKYGSINIPGIGEKEPVFIIRAQDKLAIPAIEMYKALATSHASPLASSLNREISSFQQWKGKTKLPD